MPDNWGFVAAAYVLAAAVLGGYWRHLARLERDLLTRRRVGDDRRRSRAARPSPLGSRT